MLKLLVRSFLVISLLTGACGDAGVEQEPVVVADLRRYLREQDVPAAVTDNGTTLTVEYRVALIEYAPSSFARQQGEAGLARIRDAGFERLEFRARDLTGQQQTQVFEIADLLALITPPPPASPRSTVESADASTPAPARPRWHDPGEACRYLASQGLATGGYQSYDGESWCLANEFFSEHLPIPNEISYTATGSTERVRTLELGAETYNFDAEADRRTLARAAQLAQHLTRAALRDSLPAEATRALRAGRPGSWKIQGATVRIAREDHRPGRGFRVYLRITEAP